MAKKQPSNYIFDGCLAFDLGIDSGSNVASLPRNQCAFGINTSFRGDYITHRQSVRKLPIEPVLNSKIQGAFGGGLFQGGLNFKADTNPESIIMCMAGRQFEVFPSNDSGINCTGSEITIPGDPNPASASQAFLWQSERWMIINDGLSIPIFYDGSSSRRSQVAVNPVGVVNTSFVVPPINGTVDVTLTAPYSGLLNSVLNLSEVNKSTPPNVLKVANYIVTKVGGAIAQYQVVLKNLSDIAGTTYSNNTQLIVQPSNLGNITVVTGSSPNFTVTFSSVLPAYVVVGQTVLIHNVAYTIVTISANRLLANVKFQGSGTATPAIGNNAVLQNYNAPNVIVGLLESSFVSPAIGANVSVFLQSQFTQSNGLILFIGSGQYQVVLSQTNPPAASNVVTVQNINDTASLDPTTHLPLPVNALSTFFNLAELPPARMGTYGYGRNWQSSIDGLSFIGGDIVGGASGSPAFNGRDGVLKFTQNTASFHIPSAGEIITGMAFAATLDASLGQGPLQVFTNKNIFSCQAPADSTTWANLTSPVLTESLKGAGASGQDAIISVNSDIVFRSPDGAIRSQILARKDFNSFTNAPISFEMDRILKSENLDLMPFCSGIGFDNRVLITADPSQRSNGVFWGGVMSFNLDPLSTISKKTNALWEGAWTGLNVLKLIRFRNVERAFALCANQITNNFEIYEILAEGDSYFDNGTIPIPWTFEMPMLFHEIKGKGVFDFARLEDGEMYASDVQGKVTFNVEYRADYDACWHPWHGWTICAGQGNDQTSLYPQYRKRMGFGQPEIDPADCNVNTDEPPMYGTMFQLRVSVTGHCVVNGVKLAASLQPQPMFSEPICSTPPESSLPLPPVVPACDNSNINSYALKGYDDGQIINSTGNSPSFYTPAITTVWDGTFKFKDDGTTFGTCNWTAAPANSGGNQNVIIINGKCASCVSVYFFTNYWYISIIDDQNNTLWSGNKKLDDPHPTSPEGVYYNDNSGTNLSPTYFIVEQIAGNAVVGPTQC